MNEWRASRDSVGRSSLPEYSRLPKQQPDSDDENDFIRRQIRAHHDQIRDQDEHLEEIGQGVERLGHISLQVRVFCHFDETWLLW